MALPWFRTCLSNRGKPALNSDTETEGKSFCHALSVGCAAEKSVVLLGESKEPHTQEEKKTATHTASSKDQTKRNFAVFRSLKLVCF